METFNKLAGVRDVTKPLPPPPPPIPHDEPSEQTVSRRASRASLPRDLHRSPSRRSLRSSKHAPSRRSQEQIPPLPQTPHTPGFVTAREASAESEPQQTGRPSITSAGSDEEFEWGPSHPCFPHVNPHCLPDSEEYRNTRVIRVKRDWLVSGDLYPQYQNLYPDILDPLVSDTDFRFLITNLNTRLETIFNPWAVSAWVDAILGVLTGFLWDDFGLTSTKRGIKDLESFIERWNRQKAGESQDVRLIQLRRTGFMSLDFIVPDPGLDSVDADDPHIKE
ncbi:hypothetical protein AMS68_005046 [Peltaster fructicola]|uniref:Ras modification protein ERF4 n=1 Tax=Peltaster fructicola TaxID=286661 RepID=A0A6H0XY31_9PEZI|nr:hypothetical protein AMS68_005046 [Peltaster fructicola]